MADIVPQIKELQDDFRAITGRAAWVGACVVVRPGQICAIGLGRTGAARYAIYRIWNCEDRPLPPLPPLGEGEDFGPNEPVFSELLTLTSRAGMLLIELLQSGRYNLEHMVGVTIPYQLFDTAQWWLMFLLHSLRTLGHCVVRGPGGTACACSQISQGEMTLAWIDQYPEVCLAALAGLEADLLAGSRRWPNGGKRRKRQSGNEGRDRYCYTQLKAGKALKEIQTGVNRQQGWDPLETPQAVSQAAKRYAQRHGKKWPI